MNTPNAVPPIELFYDVVDAPTRITTALESIAASLKTLVELAQEKQ